jgi:hypothetical protein
VAGLPADKGCLTPDGPQGYHSTKSLRAAMSKPRFHIRHVCRTYYLSEWWDE